MDLWNEPLFQVLVQSLEDCVLLVDRGGRVTAVHCRRPAAMLPPGELAGRSIEEVFPVEVARAFHLARQALERTGLPQSVNYRLELEDDVRHFSARLAAPETGAEHPGILVTIWDVTGHALTHQTMLASEVFYRLLADNASDLIVLEELDGT